MKKCNQLLATVGMLAIAGSAQATLINFQGAADSYLGESAWSTFNTAADMAPPGFFPDIEITAGNDHVYFDSGVAGIGVCSTGVTSTGANPSSISNLCNPPTGASDDNVDKAGETLTFTFNEAVDLNSIWLNSNHDTDGSLAGNTILLNGSSYLISAAQEMDAGRLGFQILFGDDGDTGISSFFAADSTLTVGFGGATANNSAEQFYVSAIDVPEPGPLALLGLGLIGLYAASKKKAA